MPRKDPVMKAAYERARSQTPKRKALAKANYLANRAKRIRQAKEYKAAHPEDPEKKRAAWRRYAAAHPEEMKARTDRYRAQNADKVHASQRRARLKMNFGLTTEQYDEILAAQGHVCAICRRPESYVRFGKTCPLSVDHDHETGKVRGLLCNHCNRGIGMLGDDPLRLRSAVAYLERAR